MHLHFLLMHKLARSCVYTHEPFFYFSDFFVRDARLAKSARTPISETAVTAPMWFNLYEFEDAARQVMKHPLAHSGELRLFLI